jgi:hypothetical protein
MIYSAKYETHNGLKKWCVLQIDLFRNALVYWDQISQTDIIQDTEQRFEKNLIDASANANPHLNHWNNSVKRWNVNGKEYHRSEYEIWFDPCHGDVE